MSDRSMSWDYATTKPSRVIHCIVYHKKELKQYMLAIYPQVVTRLVRDDGTTAEWRTTFYGRGLRAKLQDCERFNRGRLEELRYAAPHLAITGQMIRQICEQHNLELLIPEGKSVAEQLQAH